MLNPRPSHRCLMFPPFQPVIIRSSKSGSFLGISKVETLGKSSHEHGHGNEGPGHLDQRKPFGMVMGHAHRVPPCWSWATARCGTRKVTAIGNRRGLGS